MGSISTRTATVTTKELRARMDFSSLLKHKMSDVKALRRQVAEAAELARSFGKLDPNRDGDYAR